MCGPRRSGPPRARVLSPPGDQLELGTQRASHPSPLGKAGWGPTASSLLPCPSPGSLSPQGMPARVLSQCHGCVSGMATDGLAALSSPPDGKTRLLSGAWPLSWSRFLVRRQGHLLLRAAGAPTPAACPLSHLASVGGVGRACPPQEPARAGAEGCAWRPPRGA